MKKTRILFFLAFFMTAVVIIYWNLDSPSPDASYQRQLTMIDDRINVLENDIKETQVLLETIRSYVRRLATSYERRLLKNGNINVSFVETQNVVAGDVLIPGLGVVGNQQCPRYDSAADIKVNELVASLPFDNVDGGVWKQGFDITPNPTRWTRSKPLKVFVVPHSHTDPGWIKTVTKYYEGQTRNILDTMLIKLEEDKNRKFIYGEIVFFAMWWSDLNDGDRQKVRDLLSSGRLELVGGGWVMPDEAVTHYYGVLDQLQEGHSWTKRNLDIEVRAAWAIDPFGHSPTIAYMHKGAGLNGGVLQRVHYSLKKKLAHDKNLEFYWRQQWDDTGETDFMSHMMPFYSYDVPHTCGPNPAVCCQFDFKRLSDVSKIRCPWNKPPIPITSENVAERAAVLVDQYKKKAELFRTDSLFIPLGDDFRWDAPVEWDAQTSNYGRLFAEINSNTDWNVHIQWGTLSDYLSSVSSADRTDSPIDSLSGDFFTYADRDFHYWSGYYTSRPFQKKFSRVVESQQRAADILYSLALAECRRFENIGDKKCLFPAAQIMSQLTGGRRNLAVFQHHDGISGTAREHVVEDYGIRLLSAFQDARYVQQIAASFLLLSDKSTFLSGDQFNVLTALDSYPTHDSMAELFVIRPEESSPRWVTVFNSLGWRRKTTVRLLVSIPHVSVICETSKKPVRSESSLHWISTDQASPDTFQLVFEVDIKPLAIAVYRIEVFRESGPDHFYAETHFYNAAAAKEEQLGPFTVKRFAIGSDAKVATIASATSKANINLQTGTLSSLLSGSSSLDISVQFVSYGVKEVKEKSGAYLFIPSDNDPKPVRPETPPLVRISNGVLQSEAVSFLPMVEHKYILKNYSNKHEGLTDDIFGDIRISNVVDIRGQGNFEFAMRVQSSLKNKDKFYTDLNGFQMTMRKRYSKLSLQGNFYPITSAIAIEEDADSTKESGRRLTLLTAQPGAATSPVSGAVEIMLDRKLLQDDNRGLGQPLKDNKRMESHFDLLLENPTQSSPTGSTRMSLAAHHNSLDLMYGLTILPVRSTLNSEQVSRLLPYNALGTTSTLPCDLHLVSLRPLQEEADARDAIGSKPVGTIIPHERPILSLHRLLTRQQCAASESENDKTISVETLTTTCIQENNETKLSAFFTGLGSQFPKTRFEATLLSGKRSSLLLSPNEHSGKAVIPPGHIRSFMVTFS